MTPLLFALTIQATTAEITVDATKQTPISPYIYGVNFPNNWIYEWLDEWRDHHDGFTLARESGNRFTAYNWETNASNAGADYFHENDDYLGLSNEPGWTVSRFLRWVQDAGAAAIVTVPTLGYVSADKRTDMFSGRDVIKTPDYLNVRFNKSYARKPGGKLSYPPDTRDKAVYQDEFVSWVQRIKSRKSPVWFTLDNEPDFWYHTHERIVGAKPTYKRIIDNNIEYASMIKSLAPDSLVFGPVNYGFGGLRDFQGAPDAKGRFFVDTYLQAMKDAEKQHGKRLVDVYDFHYYSEVRGEGIRIVQESRPDKPGTGPARIQAPRSLWDPTFIEGSWINESLGNKPMRLIPMMQERVAHFYPGTKLAITEYDFGGTNTISGALAQADALGIFGRYGLFAACHFGLQSKNKAAFAAFQAFTNYDRKGSRFGDRGLAVGGENPSENSIYASLDSKDASKLTLVVINKLPEDRRFRFNIKGFRANSGRGFLVCEGAYEVPTQLNPAVAGGRTEIHLPAHSIATLELRR